MPIVSRMKMLGRAWSFLFLAFIAVPSYAAELNIQDGVVVKFGANAGLVVRDKLAVGKEVVLTSYRDGSLLPLDASVQTPLVGDWAGLKIEKSSASFGVLSISDLTCPSLSIVGNVIVS